MSREYALESGEVIPPELLDKIHADGRLFEAAQQPAARSAVHLRKIANDIPRIRQVLVDLESAIKERVKVAERQSTAIELQALFTMGFSSRQIRDTEQAKMILAQYGLLGVAPEYGDNE